MSNDDLYRLPDGRTKARKAGEFPVVDIDKIALEAAREIRALTPTNLTLASATRYQARIQCIVIDAIKKAANGG